MNLKKIIKEEMDDLQWIKDINPEREHFYVDEIIRVHNVGDEEAFLDFLGMWKPEYLRGDFGPNITGRVSIEKHAGTFGLMVKGRDGDMAEIYFPYPRLMKRYQNSIVDYPGLGIAYEVLSKESITESKDALKWIKDIQEVLPKNEDWILVNDVDMHDIEEGKKIQKYVFNHDIPWVTGDKRVMSLPIHTIHHKNQQKGIRKGFTYRSTDGIERTKNIIEQWEKAGLLVLYWSQIKPKEITESDDPLQWIKDVKVNPWDGKEFKIDTHLYPSTTYKILDWGDPKGVRVVWREDDDYRNKWKHANYKREEVENYVNNGTWVIVNENITEGEDDLDWIRDVEPEDPYNPYIGMKWVVKDEKTLSLDPIVYEIIDMTQEGMILKWVGNRVEVKSAPFSLENYLKLVKDGRVKIVNNIVKESDELQWIKDIEPDRNTPQKGFIYRYYGYTDGFSGVYDDIGTDDIIITAVVDDKVYFDTVNRYWANHPHDPGSDNLHIASFNDSVDRGDIQYLGISGINESDDPLQWIKDVGTIVELKVGSCFTDVMDPTQKKWVIINFKMTPAGTRLIVVKNNDKIFVNDLSLDSEDIMYIHEEYFEQDLSSGRYKPCLGVSGINESEDDLQWIKDVNPIPELKVGSCFIDSMTQREWTIVGLPKVGKSRTEMVRVLSNTIRKDDGAIIPSRYVNIRREYFEWDLVNGRYKPCQR